MSIRFADKTSKSSQPSHQFTGIYEKPVVITTLHVAQTVSNSWTCTSRKTSFKRMFPYKRSEPPRPRSHITITVNSPKRHRNINEKWCCFHPSISMVFLAGNRPQHSWATPRQLIHNMRKVYGYIFISDRVSFKDKITNIKTH